MKTILLDTSIDYTSWDISETESVEMTDEPDSLLVHCGSCKHEWFAFKLPMPLFEAAELATKMRCPECRKPSIQIYYGPAPVDKINTSSERVYKTGES